MSAGTSASFCLIVCFLFCSSEAQTKITAKTISAELGENVILPSKAPISNIRAVEWSRPDQDPKYVLSYRDGRLDPVSQHPSYQNRVNLQDKEMKDGNVSLILKNVTIEDTGTYECRIFEKGNNDPISIITLRVRLSTQEMIGAEKITAVVGQNVTLPCEVPNINNNKTITAVEWIRPDEEGEYVLYYHDGPIGPVSYHPCYKNWVDLQDKEMKDGDVSMILKNVKMEDTGRYECWVPQRKNNEPINTVNLEVYPSENPWKTSTIVVGVFLGVFILSTVGFAYKIRQIRKKKKKMQKEIKRGVPLAAEGVHE